MIMQYRKDKNGNEISVLGYGCMRFTKEGGHADIDKAEKEVMAAIDAGVNYLDTAYVYAGNEAAVGEILARNHCRERIYLATKAAALPDQVGGGRPEDVRGGAAPLTDRLY